MKLKELMEKQTRGSYAAVTFSQDTIDRLRAYIKTNKIPNPIRTDNLHTTLLYSRKFLPNYEPVGAYEIPMKGKPVRLDVWKTKPTDGSNPANCLVLEYDCPELTERHNLLMQEHEATYDYPEYKSHITLSYSIGNMDHTQLSSLDKIGLIEIVEEYGEDLESNWAVTKGSSTNE